MRIISGTQRGRKLIALEGDAVRPTPDRVKEALFNILQFQVEGRQFLDLFAGSGQIGLEALSRGAARAVFADSAKKSVQVIEKNLQATGFEARARVCHADALAFVAGTDECFDLVFLDPPYHSDLLARALPLAAERMNAGGVMVCEHPAEQAVPEAAGDFRRHRVYRYGKILLTTYRHRDFVGRDNAERVAE